MEMAEFSCIVPTVLDLLPLCRDAFNLIKQIFDRPGTLELPAARLEFIIEQYDSWREIWRDEEGRPDLGFEAFATSFPLAGRKVLDQAALIALVLCDTHGLEFKYGIKASQVMKREAEDLYIFRLEDGIQLTPETQGNFLERCAANLSYIKRCKFMLRKKGSPWIGLIDLLRGYIEIISSIGPKSDIDRLLRGELDIVRKMQLPQLHRLSEAADYEMRHSYPESDSVRRYHEISLAAKFRAAVKFEALKNTYKFTLCDFLLDPSYAISSPCSTMALLFDYPVRKEHRIVLIEWADDLGTDQEYYARAKAHMLESPKPDVLLLPGCYGIVEDPIRRRFGLVLATPSHIRYNQAQIRPADAISPSCMPFSLRELLERRHSFCVYILDLGTRISLAKKLIAAVHAMHCVGWVHENLRSSCILFFPSQNQTGHPHPIDYDCPVLLGLCGPHDEYSDAYRPNSHDLYSDGSASESDVWIDSHIERRDIQRRDLQRREVRPSPKSNSNNYYAHPDKRWNPAVRYSRAHDIYSLGCLLLEIGLWEPLEQVTDVLDRDYDRVKRALQEATLRLDGMTGSIYANVVRRCLAINTGQRTENETRFLWKFCADIVSTLDVCVV